MNLPLQKLARYLMFLCLVLMAPQVWAQTASLTPAPRPAADCNCTDTGEAGAAQAEPEYAPGTLALVNGQAITVADLSPRLRNVLTQLEDGIATARRQELELQINTILFETEAQQRRVTVKQLLETEVQKQILTPTESEIQAVLALNRDKLAGNDPASLRAAITNFLREQQEQRLTQAFAGRLRVKAAITLGADVNAPGLEPTSVLATVNGRSIQAQVIHERLAPVIYEMRLKVYEAQRRAVELKINDLLLATEATRQKISTAELIESEILTKVKKPAAAEVEQFYQENQSRIDGTLATRRVEIAAYLEEQERRRIETALAERLRQQADIRILLREPEPPIQDIDVDDDTVQGDATAPVTMVIFTDYQCPACAYLHGQLEAVLRPYGRQVRLVIRDFPLERHPQARKAAEAAEAARAQGQYTAYTALLFAHQGALDLPQLKAYAQQLGLDQARFNAALEQGTYAAEVEQDVVEGQRYGVAATPTVFINGVRLRQATPAAVKGAIERALTGTRPTTPAGA